MSEKVVEEGPKVVVSFEAQHQAGKENFYFHLVGRGSHHHRQRC